MFSFAGCKYKKLYLGCPRNRQDSAENFNKRPSLGSMDAVVKLTT